MDSRNLRILVITQIIDRKDSTLGFFTRWTEEIANRVGSIKVICLKKGSYELPSNVEVASLGKEDGHGNRFLYILRFYRLLFQRRGTYDVVFVHMNQEYILLAGWYWWLIRKPVMLWRNHYAGSWKTWLAIQWCTKVFCTSRYSYTAKFKKTKIMPVGVDIESIHIEKEIAKIPKSILFLGRFDVSKRPMLLVEALGVLAKKGIIFTATFVGGPSESSSTYPQQVQNRAKELGIADQCSFVGAIANTETYTYYRSHEIYVNCADDGMLDKTIFKAAASGCLVLSSSEDMAASIDTRCIFKNNDVQDLNEKLAEVLSISSIEKQKIEMQYAKLVEANTLSTLINRLVAEMNQLQ